MQSSKSRSLTLLPLVLLLAVSLGWIIFQEDGHKETTPGSPIALAEQTPEAPEPELYPLAPELAAGIQEAATEVERTAIEAPVAAPDATLTSRMLAVLFGSVVIQEPDEAFTEDAAGMITLIAWQGNSQSHIGVPIVDGNWSLNLKQESNGTYSHVSGIKSLDLKRLKIAVDSVTLNEETSPLILMDTHQRIAFSAGPMLVRAKRPEGTVLQVQAAATGLDLDQVKILSIREWTRNSESHPGDLINKGVMIEAASSPIDLKPSALNARLGPRACLVGSPGYAWTPIEIDFAGGGSRRVLLERGGDLEIFLDRVPETPKTRIQLRSENGAELVASHPIAGTGPYVFKGLAEGTLQLSVETGNWWDSPLSLAKDSVEIVADESKRVTMTVTKAPEIIKSRLEGILQLPIEWELEEFSLNLEFLETALDGSSGDQNRSKSSLEELNNPTDRFGFSFREKQHGKYKLTLSELEYSIIIEHGSEANSEIQFEIPPPVKISVLLLDESTGQPADIDKLLWNCKRPKGAGGGVLQPVQRLPDETHFNLLVPRFEIEFMFGGGAYTHGNETIEAYAGLEIVLKVRPAAQALVHLKDGATLVPWPDSDWGTGGPLDGEGSLGTRGHRDKGLWFSAPAPGPYRLEIPPVVGFEQHAPIEIDLIEGQTTEVDVQLTRII